MGNDTYLRLPWQYTPLEYIEGDGTCSIYTGFIPKSNNLRLRVDFAYTNTQGAYSIAGGARSIRSGGGYVGSIACYFLSYSVSYGNMYVRVGEKSYTNAFRVNVNTRYTLDVEALDGNATASLGGKTVTLESVGNLNHTYGIYLFCDASNTGTRAPAKMWSAQIWSDGELVRDMVPVRRYDGLVGMYDLVTETMMGNRGPGVFTAGPSLPYMPYLITDRAESDVLAAIAIKNKILTHGLYSLTTDEKNTYFSGMKGGYNYTDMNRVESVVVYLSALLQSVPEGLKEYAAELGVAWDAFFDVPYTPSSYTFDTKTDWAPGEEPEDADLTRYLSNVETLITSLEAAYPDLPDSMAHITHEDANAIERSLELLYEALLAEQARITKLLDNTPPAFWYSDEVWAGEV